MKKKFLPFFAAALVLFSSCNKSSPATNPNPNPNPPGGGGGGGGTGSLTVTSIVPTNPYPDDEFTITGTGFNTNATLDTVEFGHLVGSNFGAWHSGVPSEYASLCDVISASATQLKVKAVNPFNLDYSSFNFSITSTAVAQIRTGGKKVVTPLIPFKRLMRVNSTNDPDTHITWPRPADSMEILGQGFNKHGLQVSINGIALSNFTVDSTPNSAHVGLRLPKSFFGSSLDETLTDVKTLTVVNADGKTINKDFTFYISPTMRIYGMQPESGSYTKGSLVRIFINGRNLKNDAIVHLDSPTGIHTTFGLAVSNFPDTYWLELGTGTYPAGSYQVTVYRGTWPNDVLYGGCNFTLTN
jgi:hypothetical protein